MATGWPSYTAMPELSPSPNMWMCRRESDPLLNFFPSEGFKATSLNLQPKSFDFTGLRLSVQEDHSNATSRKELNNNNNSILYASNNLATEIQRQKEEMEQFIRVQEEGMRRSLLERTEKQSKALLCAAAAAVTRKLQEKDLELHHLKRKNLELEDQIRGLAIETQGWQKRAKNNEAMAVALKLQIDQINKEGSGDSEEEAMNTAIANMSSSSSCQVIPSNNNNNIYMENLVLEMQRKCRVCRQNEMCILLLPCRHLCLCKLCDSKIDVCPLCSALKTASVQVQIT
ncbi:probable BOI-related E3 ubiquitin-protein ligase 3 isoform X2 [Cryptomeria japonica]|nr:probable BOI-related E3 ubiquitin-protein ligase 3 isoform X2 [Cryptomeria japonica]